MEITHLSLFLPLSLKDVIRGTSGHVITLALPQEETHTHMHAHTPTLVITAEDEVLFTVILVNG